MRRSACTLVLALALLGPARSAVATTLDYQGYAFHSGALVLGALGDSLWIPVVVDQISLPGVDFATEEVTGLVFGLVSPGPQDLGDGIVFHPYGSGRFEIYRDAARNHEFGTEPPSASVPATFTDGELCLGGSLTDFTLFFDPETQSGAYEANLVFDTGSCLAELAAESAAGFTFGGVFSRESLLGNSIPAGYALAIDGYLEAQKVIVEECAFDCTSIVRARLDFARRERQRDLEGGRERERFGPRDGKFTIAGSFRPCATGGELDPEVVLAQVRIGDYVQVFPEGTLLLEGDDDDGHAEWKFRNPRGTETLTDFELEREADGDWEFEIAGRGIPRSTLLPDDNLLVVEITLGTQSGEAQVALVQKKRYLRYRGKDSCESSRCQRDRLAGEDDDDDDCDDEGDKHAPQAGPLAAGTATTLLASPNPFNATTTLLVRTPAVDGASLAIFDVTGRIVRQLHRGALAAGEHRFVWSGIDAQGRAVASGIYVYRYAAPGTVQTHKLVVAK